MNSVLLSLNDLWYEPETLWLFLTFTRDYFAEKKSNFKFSGVTYFFAGGIDKKIGVRVCRNSFSPRNKYVYVQEVV